MATEEYRWQSKSPFLEFQGINIIGVNGFESPVNTDDYSNSHRCFSSSNGDDKQAEENSFRFSRVEEFVESNEVDVNTVEDKLDGNQHRNHISPGDEPINTDEEQS